MFKRMMPARKEPVGPIVDLDAIVAEQVPFRFKGKVHFVKPITLREFLKFTQANAEFHTRISSEQPITADELAGQYAMVIGAVCDSIKKEHILEMEQAQVAALYQLIIDVVTGQVKTGGEPSKKKRVKLPIYDFEPQKLSPSAQGNSAGQ